MRLKLFLLATTLLTPSVMATSYVMIHDDVLTDQARLVLVGGAKQLFFCNLTESDLRSDSPVV